MRYRTIVLALGCVVLATLIAAGAAVRALRPTLVPPAWATDYDVNATTPETIAPGTVVDRSAPEGWSHLVIKSLPRVRLSEVERVPSVPIIGRDLTVRMVGWMFTAFTADVVKERQGVHTRYRLRAIGLGLGTNAKGCDVVVTTETARQHGVEMNFIKDEVLTTGYRIQKQAVIPVHGPSFAILDTPVISRCGDRHRTIRYRYALLVDTKTGTLDVLLWLLGGDGGECADLTRVVWIEPNCIDEAELVPDPKEFDGGRPSDLSFAVDKLPPYRVEMPLLPELRELAGKTKFTPDEAHALEDGLRKMTAQSRP